MVSPLESPHEDCFPGSSEKQRPPAEAADAPDCRKEGVSGGDGGRYSDNLGFWGVELGVNSTLVIDGCRPDSSRHGDEISVECDGFVVLRRKSGSPCDEVASKKLKTTSDESLGVSEPIRSANAKTDTEALDLEDEDIGERLDEDEIFVDLPMRATNVGVVLGKGDEVCKHCNGGLARKNVEDLDKFKRVGPSGVNRKVAAGGGVGQRELPPSISEEDKTMGRAAGPGTLAGKNKILKVILDALKLVEGELDDDSEEEVDFLKTAMKCGMTFPRPRWWPPEGYDF